MKILLSSDQKDEKFNENLIQFLNSIKYEYEDISQYSNDEVNYIIEGIKVGESVSFEDNVLGIVISDFPCGVVIAANKVNKIRCVNLINSKMAVESKKIFNPNIIVLGPDEFMNIKEIISTFLETKYDDEIYNHGVNTLLDYETSCIDC